jgi:hypothetical protein
VDSLAIGPRGTPTPAALVAAGATLPPEGDRTIVLISDGRSSCGDPCPAAQALKHRLGEGFRIDAVGFRTPDQAESELACVARVTGGTYVSVSDTAALQAALAEASAARVTSLSVSPRGFAAAVKGATVGKVTPRKGAHVLYTVSESAQVRFTVRRARVGRRVRGECRKRTAENRRARRCTRYVRLRGHIVLEAVQGENRFGFRGRWGGEDVAAGPLQADRHGDRCQRHPGQGEGRAVQDRAALASRRRRTLGGASAGGPSAFWHRRRFSAGGRSASRALAEATRARSEPSASDQ